VNLWFAAGAVIALVLISVALIGIRRPRHAEDELRQPSARPISAGTPGSFDASSLRKWLLSANAQRVTGTLQVTAGGRTCSIYFLFGHLFHVASDTLTGEPALQECLTWQDIQYTFDPKAKLPTEETIERPVDQILA
jgi:Domain of unknown function (DUF4388)